MKNAFFRIAAGLLLAVTTFAGGFAWAGPTNGADPVPQVDVWGEVGNTVDGGNDLGQAAQKVVVGVLMDKKHAGNLLDKVSGALSKVGIKGGRVFQAQILKKIGGAVDKLVKVFDFGIAFTKASDAWKAGDRAAFNKIVADYLIDMAAWAVGQAAEKGTFAFVTGSTCGLGALPGYAAGAAAGWAAEKGAKWLLHKYAQESLENLIGKVWDDKHGNGGDGDNDGGKGNSPSDGNVSAGDLEDLDGNQGNGNGGNGPNGGGKKPTYQKPQGIKAHQWGTK